MKAVVLAAGSKKHYGSRNRLTYPCFVDKPKCLYSIDGKVQLDEVLENIQEAGIEKTRVVVGYKADAIRDHLATTKFHVEIVYNKDYEKSAIYSIQVGLKDIYEDALLLFADERIPVAQLRAAVATEGGVVVFQRSGKMFPSMNFFKIRQENIPLFLDTRFKDLQFVNEIDASLRQAKFYPIPSVSSGYFMEFIFLYIMLKLDKQKSGQLVRLPGDGYEDVRDLDSFLQTDEYKNSFLRYFTPYYYMPGFLKKKYQWDNEL